MDAGLEQWFCVELSKLGIDATEENAQYILSIEDPNDLEEYMAELLDASDPKVRVFLQDLRSRCKINGTNDVQVYQKKGEDEYQQTNKSKKKQKAPSLKDVSQSLLSNGSSHNIETNNHSSVLLPGQYTELHSSVSNSSTEIGIGAKKKSKYVPLYSKEGQAKAVIQLPGRHTCECQAAKHILINNCTQCGRIVCEQEGPGPCVFCGNLVCTPEDQEVISRGSKKGEKMKEYLMKGGKLSLDEGFKSLPQSTGQSYKGMEKALKHRDKLLEYDRNSTRRTQVIDDECDYYATDTNKWISKGDREKLRKREDELRQARHGSRRDRKITFDFAGRRVVDEDDQLGKNMYDKDDAVVKEVQYGKAPPSSYQQEICNPAIFTQPPEFVEPAPHGGAPRPSAWPSQSKASKSSGRIQDRELQEMSDQGMCMSMHQPLAAFLVCDIKMHEGRTWYTPHRGRLWIAATAKVADPDEITEMETMFRVFKGDGSPADENLQFPSDYPSACLLGCVNVDDCLAQDEYRKKFPDGLSASPYVFICSNPQQLVVKFPIKGKHKIYKLENHIHQAAKKGLR